MIITNNRRVDKPWGYEIILSGEGFLVGAKILFIKAGKRFSLQYHDQKDEVLTLYQGRAELSIGDRKNHLEKTQMTKLQGYSIKKGMIHRVEASEDSYIFEASSVITGTTFRLEDDYNRLNEVS